MDDLNLVEQVEWSGKLTDIDHDYLAAEFSQQFTIRREVREGHTVSVLHPNQYVGFLILPSGRYLRVTPKVPVSNLIYMIAYGAEDWPFREEQIQVDSIDEVFWVFAQVFAELVEQRIEEGLYRAYVEREDNLAVVRGRVVFSEDLKSNLFTRQKTFCRFAEFTWDVEENQLIRQVAHFLSGFEFPRELRNRLGRIDSVLAEVTPTNLGSGVVSRFRYNRFNESYHPIHQLCQLFLEGASLNEDLGTWNSRAFLIDMNQLFENFISQLLIVSASNEVSVSKQADISLDEQGIVNMRPDLLIKVHQQVRIAADCKYKRVETDAYNHADYYQVLAYCVACAADRGVIIYPKNAFTTQDEVQIKNANITIERRTLDLSLDLPQFKLASQRFANEVFSLALNQEMALGA